MAKKNVPKDISKTTDPIVNLWFTRMDPEFNNEMFLYHYTNFESACKILYGESLRFSRLSKTNDTVEEKLKIRTNRREKQSQLSELLTHFQNINKTNIQLMCFSKDVPIPPTVKYNASTFDDFSGRGFSLPRMWAQYGDNNKGVCLIIHKNKLLDYLTKHTKYNSQIIYYDDVKYNSVFEPYIISDKKINILKDLFSQSDPIIDYSFLKNNRDFILYNYFSKSQDWSQEYEYRILAYSSNTIYIKNLNRFLVGIVVGEKMEPVQSKIIFDLSQCKEIMQIQFNYSGCTIKNLNFKGYDKYAEN